MGVKGQVNVFKIFFGYTACLDGCFCICVAIYTVSVMIYSLERKRTVISLLTYRRRTQFALYIEPINV